MTRVIFTILITFRYKFKQTTHERKCKSRKLV